MINTAENPWLDDELIEQRRRQRRWLRSVASFVFDRRRGPQPPQIESASEATLAERLLRDHVDAELAAAPAEWGAFVHEGDMHAEAVRTLGVPDPFIGSADSNLMEPVLSRFPMSGAGARFDDLALGAFFNHTVMPLVWADALAGDGYQDQRIRLAESCR